MRDLIKICAPGGLILDPFAGSGSTLLAAQLEGYDWLGCELSEEYKAIALERFAELKEY
jgi:site-specific DNA-methyltransferase (adenine-specific)